MEAVAATWNRAHQQGSHAEAIEAIGNALGAAGEDAATAARLHYMAGCTLEDALRPAEAAQAYRRALALDPGSARAHNNLGCLLEAGGELEQATRCYELAVQCDPALANARYNLGIARLRSGALELAEADLRAALALEGSSAGWRRSLEELEAMRREPLRLHVGGKQVKPGWRILNVQPGAGVDFVGDCADLGAFAAGSVDEIYASHVLEHLSYAERLPRALAEFHRVLKPGGALRVSVPDFEVLCGLFLDPGLSPEERFHVMRMAFGGQVDAHDFHHVGLTFEILGRYLRAAGFRPPERVEAFGLFEDASALRMRGRLISLNVIARK
jgi:predicted SAM-dependent methyltransferase